MDLIITQRLPRIVRRAAYSQQITFLIANDGHGVARAYSQAQGIVTGNERLDVDLWSVQVVRPYLEVEVGSVQNVVQWSPEVSAVGNLVDQWIALQQIDRFTINVANDSQHAIDVTIESLRSHREPLTIVDDCFELQQISDSELGRDNSRVDTGGRYTRFVHWHGASGEEGTFGNHVGRLHRVETQFVQSGLHLQVTDRDNRIAHCVVENTFTTLFKRRSISATADQVSGNNADGVHRRQRSLVDTSIIVVKVAVSRYKRFRRQARQRHRHLAFRRVYVNTDVFRGEVRGEVNVRQLNRKFVVHQLVQKRWVSRVERLNAVGRLDLIPPFGSGVARERTNVVELVGQRQNLLQGLSARQTVGVRGQQHLLDRHIHTNHLNNATTVRINESGNVLSLDLVARKLLKRRWTTAIVNHVNAAVLLHDEVDGVLESKRDVVHDNPSVLRNGQTLSASLSNRHSAGYDLVNREEPTEHAIGRSIEHPFEVFVRQVIEQSLIVHRLNRILTGVEDLVFLNTSQP
ncbi:hypothetical protein D3C84_527040 [compost metagenome]